jgi:hypothetical protein
VFAYRTVDGTTGEVSESVRMHADGMTLAYPMSAIAKGDNVILSNLFTGTVQVIDRKTGKTHEMLHDFKAPTAHAAKLDHWTFLKNKWLPICVVCLAGGLAQGGRGILSE